MTLQLSTTQLTLVAMKAKYFLLVVFLSFCYSSENSIGISEKLASDDIIDPFCNGLNYENQYFDEYQNLTSLKIEIPKSGDWYKNLVSAYYDGTQYPNGYILDKYKSQFEANIIANFTDYECIFKASLRISGDWKDHIQIDEVLSSMDVKLSEGNIFGITKFKLLIPYTRYSDNEILVTTILEQLGFITPRTFYLQVDVNGLSKAQFIFQEKASKELIEYYKFREGPILEANEEHFWKTSTGIPHKENGEIFINSKVNNLYWARRNETNEFISLVAVEKLNKSIYTSTKPYNLNYFEISQEPNELFNFHTLLLALDASHGLANHNRKYFYNRITDEFLPIYYDGNSQLLDRKTNFPQYILDFDKESLEYFYQSAIELQKYFQSEKFSFNKYSAFLENKGMNINQEKFLALKNQILYNLEYIETTSSDRINNENITKNKHHEGERFEFIKNRVDEYSFIDYDLIFFNREKEELISCNNYLNICKLKSFENNNKNIFARDLEIKSEEYHIMGITNNFESDYLNLSIFENNFLNVLYTGTPKIEIDQDKIYIKINSLEDKVLIKDSRIVNKDITVESDSFYSQNNLIRYNKNLLTGCVTFYNVIFEDVNIKTSKQSCEDSLNIMNSTGQLNEINIRDSLFDGFDIDFSNLTINHIDILNSGNDCLDISNSSTSIESLKLNICSDKAISIGELSNVEMEEVQITNSKTAISVKDSSQSIVENLSANNVEYCYTLYRKKQEFGPSKLLIQNLKCDSRENSFVQLGSKYEN